MTNRQKALALAEKLDCTIIDDGYALEAIAPHGAAFASTSTTVVVAPYRDGLFRFPKGEAWHGIHEDMSMGLCDCDDPEGMEDTFPADGEVLHRSTTHTLT